VVKECFRLTVVPRHIVKAQEKVLKQESTTDFVYNEGLRKKIINTLQCFERQMAER